MQYTECMINLNVPKMYQTLFALFPHFSRNISIDLNLKMSSYRRLFKFIYLMVWCCCSVLEFIYRQSLIYAWIHGKLIAASAAYVSILIRLHHIVSLFLYIRVRWCFDFDCGIDVIIYVSFALAMSKAHSYINLHNHSSRMEIAIRKTYTIHSIRSNI